MTYNPISVSQLNKYIKDKFEEDEYFANVLVEQNVSQEKAKTYMTETINGIAKNKEEILELISQNLKEKWDISRVSKINITLLKLATYEIVYTELPYKVVVNEAVEIAKKYGDDTSPAFINGVLANIIKQTGIANEE